MSRDPERGHEVQWLDNERDIKSVAPDLADADIEVRLLLKRPMKLTHYRAGEVYVSRTQGGCLRETL
jgi:hypothetical protein